MRSPAARFHRSTGKDHRRRADHVARHGCIPSDSSVALSAFSPGTDSSRPAGQGPAWSAGGTELAWAMRVGALAVEFGYEAVVVDNCSRDAANLPPQWRSGPDGLSPVVEIEQPLGIAAKIETEVHCANAPSPITLWVRERALSNALLEAMYSEEENDERHFKVFSAALE